MVRAARRSAHVGPEVDDAFGAPGHLLARGHDRRGGEPAREDVEDLRLVIEEDHVRRESLAAMQLPVALALRQRVDCEEPGPVPGDDRAPRGGQGDGDGPVADLVVRGFYRHEMTRLFGDGVQDVPGEGPRQFFRLFLVPHFELVDALRGQGHLADVLPHGAHRVVRALHGEVRFVIVLEGHGPALDLVHLGRGSGLLFHIFGDLDDPTGERVIGGRDDSHGRGPVQQDDAAAHLALRDSTDAALENAVLGVAREGRDERHPIPQEGVLPGMQYLVAAEDGLSHLHEAGRGGGVDDQGAVPLFLTGGIPNAPLAAGVDVGARLTLLVLLLLLAVYGLAPRILGAGPYGDDPVDPPDALQSIQRGAGVDSLNATEHGDGLVRLLAQEGEALRDHEVVLLRGYLPSFHIGRPDFWIALARVPHRRSDGIRLLLPILETVHAAVDDAVRRVGPFVDAEGAQQRSQHVVLLARLRPQENFESDRRRPFRVRVGRDVTLFHAHEEGGRQGEARLVQRRHAQSGQCSLDFAQIQAFRRVVGIDHQQNGHGFGGFDRLGVFFLPHQSLHVIIHAQSLLPRVVAGVVEDHLVVLVVVVEGQIGERLDAILFD
mmetsp:Transcript_14993/g.32710  ORF Transcript_14993/g.32710 Transcript_14993/m.32710 type:complete len:604 (-) Transcript_14993:1076-2887(-)